MMRIVKDLFHDESWPLFDIGLARAIRNPVPEISMVSFVCADTRIERDIDKLFSTCIEEASGWLFNASGRLLGRPYLFVAHPYWRPPDRIVMYKKLWKGIQQALKLPSEDLGAEVLFESDQGVRFAGLARVTQHTFDAAVRFLRRNSSSAIVFASGEDAYTDLDVRRIFRCAFPLRRSLPSSSLNWMTIAIELCADGDALLRVGGSYDEREAYIECFLNSQRLSTTT